MSGLQNTSSAHTNRDSRVDEQSGVSEIEIMSFIRQLEAWKDGIPCDARQHGADKPSTRTDTLVIDGYGYYVSRPLYRCRTPIAHYITDGLLLQVS